MSRVRPNLALLALLIGLVGFATHADGMKFPPVDVDLYPGIPAQRALISFRDGIETLTIESSYDGEGDSFGWIVPIPATPTAIEEGSSGAITCVSHAVQPHVEKRARGRWGSFAATCTGLFALLMVLFAPSRRRSYVAIAVATAGLTVVFGLPFVARSRIAATRGLAAPTTLDVAVEMTAVAGALEVTVLRAGTPDDLNIWLAENGYRGLPQAGFDIAADYIAAGWRFCAARERRQGDGTSRTHALRATFPSEEPLYPMRLTSLAMGTVALQAYVISENPVTAPGLEVQCTRRFSATSAFWNQAGGHGFGLDRFPGLRHGRRTIGHPMALTDMWDGCYVTNLSGRFRARDIAEDFVFKPARAAESVKTYWTREAARLQAREVGLLACPVVFLLVMLLGYRRSHPEARRMRVVVLASILAALACFSVARVVRDNLPVATESEAPELSGLFSVVYALNEQRKGSPDAWERLLPSGGHGLGAEDAARLVFDAHDLKEGDGPLGYTFERRAGGLYVRLYDVYGFPAEVRLDGMLRGEKGD